MESILTSAQARAKLEKLFQDAGYTVPELLEYMHEIEQQQLHLGEQLKKMKQAEIRRLSSLHSKNSRLKEALRE